MRNPVIDQIQNPRIRELADQCVHRSQGDFGMVVEGGVDLELFAQRIIDACADMIQKEKDAGLYNSNQMAGMTVARAVWFVRCYDINDQWVTFEQAMSLQESDD